jgi:Lhr-like helicase
MGSSVDPNAVLDAFHPAVASWFRHTFEAPTEPQIGGWPSIRDRRHTLISAPTGSGKTLAAFLAAIDDLVVQGLDGTLADETYVVYVSPLKALSNDIHRNLESPLAGIQRQLLEMGEPPAEIRAMVRTGDTPSSERARMVRNPPHIPGDDAGVAVPASDQRRRSQHAEDGPHRDRRRDPRHRQRQARLASSAVVGTA